MPPNTANTNQKKKKSNAILLRRVLVVVFSVLTIQKKFHFSLYFSTPPEYKGSYAETRSAWIYKLGWKLKINRMKWIIALV